jgi:drug/metabolite transporter (DMT)-like permease
MPSHERPFLALGLRLAAMVMLSLMLVLVKLTGERGMPLPETMFWRQTLPAVMLLGWLGARGNCAACAPPALGPFPPRDDRHGRHVPHSGRGADPALAEATVLGFTAPVFAVILSALVLKEKVGPWRWLAVAIGLLGILVIAGPSEGKLPALGVAVGVGAAFMVALVSIQLRDLGRTEEPLTVVFYFSAMSAPLLALFLFHTGVHHDALGWLMLGGIGVLGLAAQLLMTAALRFGRVSSVIVMDYSQFGWATLWVGWCSTTCPRPPPGSARRS